ncbi:MAG: HAMP domain-containing histidine kinase [Opitutales bacterium]|nr:HAMP domain-containing histidine kinase [Opitutales bacterium]MCH8541049.1 HAMP domain-containing histidine kinase [Opitutales bacterium]
MPSRSVKIKSPPVDEKDRLLRMVAHDLRSPLTHANLHLDRLQSLAEKEKLSPTVRKLIKETEFQVRRISSLVEKLNDLDAMENRGDPINCKPTPFSRWVRISYQNHQALAKNKEIKLEGKFPREDFPVIADPEALLRIFENLLSNALKFTPRGGRISLQVGKNESYGFASISDSGPGIPEKDQKKLFERFTKLTPQPTEGEPSLGLGLSIVQHLCQEMGGKIEYSSKAEQGTTFTINLPLAKES